MDKHSRRSAAGVKIRQTLSGWAVLYFVSHFTIVATTCYRNTLAIYIPRVEDKEQSGRARRSKSSITKS
jgi:hypothetical protein